jgi:hypothetical protein
MIARSRVRVGRRRTMLVLALASPLRRSGLPVGAERGGRLATAMSVPRVARLLAHSGTVCYDIERMFDTQAAGS